VSRRCLCLHLAALLLALAPAPAAAGDTLPKGVERRLTPGGKVLALALTADGKVLASGHDDGTVRLWEANSGKELRRLTDGKGPVKTLAWLPDGRRLVSAGPGFGATLWDSQDGRKLRQFASREGTGRGTTLALAPDGRTAAFGGFRISLVDVETGNPVGKFDGGSYPAFSPSGKFLAAAAPDRHAAWALATYDLAQKKPPRRFAKTEKPDYESLITPLIYTPDGRSIVSGNFGGTVELWEPATGAQQVAYWTHPRAVTALACSPDGRLLVSAGDDQLIRVRDLASGWQGARLRGHRGRISALAFAPDGRHFWSASEDGTILQWRAPERAAPGPSRDLTAEDFDTAWAALAEQDAAEAHRTRQRLLESPAASVAFLRARIKPVKPLAAGQAERLIADLDNARFATRERAAKELEKLGRLASPALLKALKASKNDELRRRATGLLERLNPEELSEEELRQWRALAVVEFAGTPEARRLLQEWARGAPGALLTTGAGEALERLKRQSPGR
jgi:WD40 repeat protein